MNGIVLKDVEKYEHQHSHQYVLVQARAWWVQRVLYGAQQIERIAQFEHEYDHRECLHEELSHNDQGEQ